MTTIDDVQKHIMEKMQSDPISVLHQKLEAYQKEYVEVVRFLCEKIDGLEARINKTTEPQCSSLSETVSETQ